MVANRALGDQGLSAVRFGPEAFPSGEASALKASNLS